MKKLMWWVMAAIATSTAPLGVWAGNIYGFKVSGEEDNRSAELSWVSTIGAGYVVEEADRLDGQWKTASGGEAITADDFLASATVSISNDTSATKFFRVRPADVAGPAFSFESPFQDAIAVPLASDIKVKISDDSGVSPESVTMYLDDVVVPSENLSWDGTNLVYSPASGMLGTNGQEILVRVVAQDGLGNEAEAFSTIVLERPLTVVARSVLYVGDPGLGSQTYSEVDSVHTDLPDILLTTIDDTSMTFTGAADGDITVGQYILSLVPTNIFYRKALSVTSLGSGSYCVATTNAALGEIFSGNFSTDYMENIVIYGEDGLPIGGTESPSKSGMNARGVHKVEPKLQPLNKNYKWGKTIGAEYEKDGKTYGFSYNPEITCHLLGKFSVSGQFDPFNANNDDLTFFLHSELHFEYETTVEFSRSLASPYERKKKIPCSTLTAWLGSSGLFIKFDFDLYGYLKLNADAAGQITKGAKIVNVFQLHRRKKGDDWYPCFYDLGPSGYTESRPYSFDISGTASARVGVGVQITAYFEGLMGPFISGGPFLEGSITRGISNGRAYTTKKVIAGAEVDAGIDSRFIKIPSLGTLTLHADIYSVLYEHTDMEFPPVITLPETMTVAEGQEVNLVPQAISGNEPIIYTWEKNGISIPSVAPSGILSFTATEKSAGRYKVTATNLGGSTSREVLVQVTPQYSLADFAGKWRQVSPGPENNAYRQFNICPDGTGYYHWLEDGKFYYTTRYPLRSTLLEDGKSISVVRIVAATGREDHFKLRLTGKDSATLLHHDGFTLKMKRISVRP